MTVHVWVGRQPQGYEAEVLRTLARVLTQAEFVCHLMANFVVNGHELDLLVLKPDAIFLVELKQTWGAVRGDINGVWTVSKGSDRRPLHGGSIENPYQQMLTQYRVLTEWLEKNKREFLSHHAAWMTCFRPDRRQRRTQAPVKIRSLLVFYPDLLPGSELSLDWKVEPVRFPDLAAILMHETTPRTHLSGDEMAAIAQQLHLEPWTPAVMQSSEAYTIDALAGVNEYSDVNSQPADDSAHSVNGRWSNAQLDVLESLIAGLTQYCKQMRLQLETIGES